MCCVLGLFCRAFPFSAPIPSVLFPLSSRTSPLSHFTPPLPFQKEVNKKLSYRGQNVLSVVKHTNAIPTANILYFSVRQYRLAGGIMFSTCPFVRPSVCPSVCLSVRPSVRPSVRLLPTCERYTSKTNEPISVQIGINLPPWQGHERSTSAVRRSKVKVTGGWSYAWKSSGDIILDPLNGVNRGMQLATEMLPLKMGVLNIVSTAPIPAFVVYASC